MKKCLHCNKLYSEDLNYCSTCGASLIHESQLGQPSSAAEPVSVSSHSAQQPFEMSSRVKSSDPVSISEWMILFVNLIPCIGPIIYFVIMVIWACSKDIKPSKNSFAKASLIFMGVVFVLFGFYLLFNLLHTSPAPFHSAIPRYYYY